MSAYAKQACAKIRITKTSVVGAVLCKKTVNLPAGCVPMKTVAVVPGPLCWLSYLNMDLYVCTSNFPFKVMFFPAKPNATESAS